MQNLRKIVRQSLEEITQNPPVTYLYHGTSDIHLDSIQTKGLKDPYLTSDYEKAGYYATEAAEELGGEPIVLKVVVPNTNNLIVDYNELDEPVNINETDAEMKKKIQAAYKIYRKENPTSYDKKFGTISVNKKDYWVSLLTTNTVKYEGVIPFDNVKFNEGYIAEGYYTTWKKIEEGSPIDKFEGQETEIVQKLTKHLNISKIAPLGQGTSGFAYHIPNNKVLKITKDKTEVAEAHKIQGKKMKHLANVYKTYSLKGKYEGTYVIISELLQKTEEIDNADQLLANFLNSEFDYSISFFFEDYSNGSMTKEEITDYSKRIKKFYEPNDAQKTIWYMMGKFGIINEIKNYKIHSTDWGLTNLGLKKDGNLAMYDLGYGDPNVPNAVNNINLNEEIPTTAKRKVYVLIGPPAVGKSTFIKNKLNNSTVISRDDIATNVAARFGITYDELFSYPLPTDKVGKTVQEKEKYGKVMVNDNERMKQFFPLAFENIQNINTIVDQELNSSLEKAINSNGNIVIDMTNMDKKGRAANLGALATHPEFEKIAIVFNFQDPKSLNVILKMAKKRSEEIKAQGGSKTITPDIMKRIISKYEEPTSAEGFDKILHVNTIGNLRKALYEKAPNDYPDFMDGQFNPTFHARAYPPIMNINIAPLAEVSTIRRRMPTKDCEYILKKLGYPNAAYLGSGQNGDAFETDNKVIKITADVSEARLANDFKGKNFKHLANVYDVKKYQLVKDNYIYIIVMEKLRAFNKNEKQIYKIYDIALSQYEQFVMDSGDNIPFKNVINNLAAPYLKNYFHKIKTYINSHKQEIINLYNQVKTAQKEVKSSIDGSMDNLNDMHSGNVGKKPNGNIAYYDLRWWDFEGKAFTGVKTIKEIELTPDEINKKELPLKYHYKWGDFIKSKGAAVREIMPNIGDEAISNTNTDILVKDLAEKEPAVYDEFAEWIYQDLHSKSTIGEGINSHKEISLKQAIKLSQLSDINDVGTWLQKNIKDIKFYYSLEPINIFMETILEMESTYDDFPDEAERSRKIFELLQQGEKPKAIFIEKNDSSKFIMEGRHRIVAFKWFGLEKVPVIYVS